jgi:hypothetical protein
MLLNAAAEPGDDVALDDVALCLGAVVARTLDVENGAAVPLPGLLHPARAKTVAPASSARRPVRPVSIFTGSG